MTDNSPPPRGNSHTRDFTYFPVYGSHACFACRACAVRVSAHNTHLVHCTDISVNVSGEKGLVYGVY